MSTASASRAEARGRVNSQGDGAIRHAAIILFCTYLAALTVAVAAKSAHRWPVPPAWWQKQAACIRSHEGWWTANTGNGYYGAYQFLYGTWASVGGRGLPSNATPAEQTYRAWLVWRRDGGSWREWGTAGMCGLR